MNSSASMIPPGLTCDQYYLYLASGYAYSFTHGVMYRISQVPSERWIPTVLNPYRLEETAYWLSLRHYYDFGQHCWTQATFDKSEHLQERIWQESKSSQTTFFRLQQKAGDIMNMMARMNLKSTTKGHENYSVDIKPKPSVFTTMRSGKGQKTGRLPRELKRVQLSESKHKSQRSQVREKIKTLPPTLALRPDFWKSVL